MSCDGGRPGGRRRGDGTGRAKPVLSMKDRLKAHGVFSIGGRDYLERHGAVQAARTWFELWAVEDAHTGLAHVGIDRLAARLRVDVRTVSRDLSTLTKLGFVEVVSRGYKGGPANAYRVHPYPPHAVAERAKKRKLASVRPPLDDSRVVQSESVKRPLDDTRVLEVGGVVSDTQVSKDTCQPPAGNGIGGVGVVPLPLHHTNPADAGAPAGGTCSARCADPPAKEPTEALVRRVFADAGTRLMSLNSLRGGLRGLGVVMDNNAMDCRLANLPCVDVFEADSDGGLFTVMKAKLLGPARVR